MTDTEWQETQRQAQRDIIAMFALPPELITDGRNRNLAEGEWQLAAEGEWRLEKHSQPTLVRRKKGKRKHE